MRAHIDTEPSDAERSEKRSSMKLVVLGATGGTGLEIVRQAIERGHSVTALVRSPDRLKAFRSRITVEQGDLLNRAELEKVIRGHDAVLSGFGPRVPIAKADAHLRQQFAGALTSAMRRAGVRRVVIESVAFLFKNSSCRQPTFSAGCFFLARLQIHPRWNGSLREATSIGP